MTAGASPERSADRIAGSGSGFADCEALAMKNEATIDGITVGGQPTAADLANSRFATVINLRRDDEPGNDTGALLAGSGVAYTAVPWTIETVTKDDITQIRAAVAAASGPVLIH